jgi:glycosyltransferase involved in cell wall biosynthesis
MRIAVNARFLIRDKLEGIGWFTHETLRRIVAQAPEHEFVFLFDRPFDEAFIYGDNVQPAALFPPARHPFLWWWWFEKAVPAALKKHRADIFLSPDGYCSLSGRTPTVMVTHDIAHAHFPDQVPWAARKYYNYFVPRFLQRADRIVTVSEFVKKDICGHYGIESAKIDVAGNGAREGFQPLTGPERSAVREKYAGGREYFFYVGSINPRKNVHRLIAAFDRFKKRTHAPVQLLLAGRFGWQTGEVREAYEQARFREDIRFLGYVSEDELPLLMGGSLALVYASLFEGFGVPLLEAMHAETPVITSNVASMPEVAGRAAWLVDPLITDQIAIAMQLLYEEPQRREALIREGRTQRGAFSWDRAADVLWKAVEKVC